jgi:hypothetical protein
VNTEQFLRDNFTMNEDSVNMFRTYNTLVMYNVHKLVTDKLLQLEKIGDLNETNNYSLAEIKYHVIDLQTKILEELNT